MPRFCRDQLRNSHIFSPNPAANRRFFSKHFLTKGKEVAQACLQTR